MALPVLKDFMSMMTSAKERVGVVLHRDGGSHWHIGSSRKEEPLRLAAELLVDLALRSIDGLRTKLYAYFSSKNHRK